MFFESMKITGLAIAQIVLLGGVGYLLVKTGILKKEGVHFLSRLIIEVTLPIMIFCQLLKDFNFTSYGNWWLFPVLSIIITCAGLLVGFIFSVFIKGGQHKIQFLCLSAFQNAAYLPIVLISALMPKEIADKVLVYLFLFLLGFNVIIWSFGVYMLTFNKARKFELNSLFSPPVLATIISLLFVYFGLEKIIPGFVIKPFKMIGDCTVPLAMFVVSGNLADIKISHIDKKAVFLITLVKLIILPLVGLWLVISLNVPCLIGLLIVMQLAVPSATSLSVIISHCKKEDLLISQGIFFGHILSLISVPVFLSLYFTLVGWPGCMK